MLLKLDENVNYIVSGLERSGTSMMMQILHSGRVPVAYDTSRPADESNPKGYFELEGGKILNKLMDGTFPFAKFKGGFLKITAFGLQYLPIGKYKIIYMERNLDEVLDSMEKMAGIEDEVREETRKSFLKLNEKVKKEIQIREDVEVLIINFNGVLTNPEPNIGRICDFLGCSKIDGQRMIGAIDNRLYRQRRTT